MEEKEQDLNSSIEESSEESISNSSTEKEQSTALKIGEKYLLIAMSIVVLIFIVFCIVLAIETTVDYYKNKDEYIERFIENEVKLQETGYDSMDTKELLIQINEKLDVLLEDADLTID